MALRVPRRPNPNSWKDRNKEAWKPFHLLPQRSLSWEWMSCTGTTFGPFEYFQLPMLKSPFFKRRLISACHKVWVYTTWIWTWVLCLNLEGVGQPEIPASFRVSRRLEDFKKELLAGTRISSFSHHEANRQPPGLKNCGQQGSSLVMCP